MSNSSAVQRTKRTDVRHCAFPGEQHFRSADITKVLKFPFRIRLFLSWVMVVRNKFAVIREEGMSKFMKDCESAPLRKSVASELNPSRAIRIRQNSSVSVNFKIHFPATDAKNAYKLFWTKRRALPQAGLSICNFFTGQSPDKRTASPSMHVLGTEGNWPTAISSCRLGSNGIYPETRRSLFPDPGPEGPFLIALRNKCLISRPLMPS